MVFRYREGGRTVGSGRVKLRINGKKGFDIRFALGAVASLGLIGAALVVIFTYPTENKSDSVNSSVSQEPDLQESHQNDMSETEQICLKVYDSQKDNPDCTAVVVNELGKLGYTAVDTENKIPMTNAEQLLSFIEAHNSGEKENVQVIRLSPYGNFEICNLATEDGKVTVGLQRFQYQSGQMVENVCCDFEADYFNYTEEGYLMISGAYKSEQQLVLTLSDEEEHIALRVVPQDEACVELCEKYILPVSYGNNNIFITDWNSEDYANIDFYDVFDKFYREVYFKTSPYVMNADLSVGNEYEIPADEFERVILEHFEISVGELRKLLRYDANNNCYIYRPRGFDEHDYADIPYPEVAGYENNDDGSVTLMVNAVFPTDDTSGLFSHKITVTEKDGKIRYLSNEIVRNEELSFWWHSERLSDEEWKENYAEMGK